MAVLFRVFLLPERSSIVERYKHWNVDYYFNHLLLASDCWRNSRRQPTWGQRIDRMCGVWARCRSNYCQGQTDVLTFFVTDAVGLCVGMHVAILFRVMIIWVDFPKEI